MFDPNNRRIRTWGFRLSWLDGGVIAIAALAALLLGHPFGWLILTVAGHFFLFCNVFRVGRKRELIWAALFVANVAVLIGWGELHWATVLLAQCPVTVAIIIAELRSPLYHGVFAPRLNPHLPDYLEGRIL